MAGSFTPGQKAFYASDSPTSSYSGVFEDDGRTGYFYAYDRAAERDKRILDACLIYHVENVVDRDRPSEIEIVWTRDGLKAALRINGRAHAVIDFAGRRASCRLNFPPPGGPWRAAARAPWSEELLAEFRDDPHYS
jgi:hypothetical protein